MSFKSCRYFSPNIFNDTKCQNCFGTKEIHLSDALECTRVTRKIVKCGYLFVAPPNCDFAENKSKRWQRRWFVLYDDGHLTYSLDEDPETVPQAVMDMNLVEEVIDADELTGNQNAIGLRGPDQAVFIKGTCRREKMWWFDILSRYPKLGSRSAKSRAKSGFSAFPSPIDNQNEVKPSPVLWLCFATNLSLGLADPNDNQTAPSNTANSNNNNHNNNKHSSHSTTQSRVMVMKSQPVDERSQQRNWINSNLSKTSQLTSMEVEEMKHKLNQARKELKSINKELRESYANYDYLEIAYDKLRQQIRVIQQDRESELNLMRHRINDLTGKLSTTERSLRLAKHCMSSRSQDRRRSDLKPRLSTSSSLSSPSSPPSLSALPKDFGGKLQDLEQKIGTIQLLMNNYDSEKMDSAVKHWRDPHDGPASRSPSGRPEKPSLSRRSSRDSDCSDSHSMLLRLHELSASVRKISDSLVLYCDNTKPCTPPASVESSSSSPSSSYDSETWALASATPGIRT